MLGRKNEVTWDIYIYPCHKQCRSLCATFAKVLGPHVLADKAPVTLGAVEGFALRVGVHVVLQVVLVCKLPVAHLTRFHS